NSAMIRLPIVNGRVMEHLGKAHQGTNTETHAPSRLYVVYPRTQLIGTCHLSRSWPWGRRRIVRTAVCGCCGRWVPRTASNEAAKINHVGSSEAERQPLDAGCHGFDSRTTGPVAYRFTVKVQKTFHQCVAGGELSPDQLPRSRWNRARDAAPGRTSPVDRGYR